MSGGPVLRRDLHLFFVLAAAVLADPASVASAADPVMDAVATPAPVAPAAAAAAPAKAASKPATTVAHNAQGRAIDRLQLESTAITGNRELPKVMSIVPWKAAEPPQGPDRPMGSLIEEMLSPVDRDEFRREITYYRELTSQSSGVAGASGPDPEPIRTKPQSSSPPGASLP